MSLNRYVVRHICPPLEGVGGGLINIYFNLFTMKEANKSNFWKYNPELNSFAKQNRRNMTKAEACLWKYLLGARQLMGYRFNRQRPVGEYIADFLCKELMLIIEVDGLTHQFEEVRNNDILREKELETLGFTIIRLDDDEVLNDIDNVKRTLMYFIEKYVERKKIDQSSSP